MSPVTGATAFLASFPSPSRGVWEIGPVPIRAYALFIIVGIILAIWWGEKRLQARGGRAGEVIDIAVYAVPFGLVGGRLYHVATDWQRYFGPGKNPVEALYIWQGGLGIWGAIALGGVGALLGCRRKGIPLPVFADAVAPGIVVAQAIGRIGNYFNQELYGAHTDLPWGMEVFQRVNPDTGQPDQLNGISTGVPLPESPVHPTFLYELIWNLLVALFVVLMDRRLRLGHGRAFALYVAGYTLGRTWIELMRRDDATQVFGVRINVWVSILVFVGAVVYFVVARKKGDREDLVALRGIPDAEQLVPFPGGSAEDKAEDKAEDAEERPKVPTAPEPEEPKDEEEPKPETKKD
ncbi:prolipoprotein diacylglyceryl transferase [Actinocrispum wychmicini]|uniref:Phosphatidylglycerol--prolipoprotein diacylglyceryl transferase n=1 Tax=Actinocrispum wychmicini TaxID=1213861 RepID=A0A4R2JHW6_9PSEU|nr:prolipoprotein diacylglyceryl transferase [Actinocrispum wychmicini]